MSRILSVRGLGLFVALLLVGFACNTAHQQSPPPQDGVFVHLTHGLDSPHRALMALQMASLMSETHDVLVYLDIEGIEVVLQDAPDLQFGEFPSSHTQLQKLIDTGVRVFACPGCLKAAGKSAEDLREGIAVARKDAFFDFTKGRILTLDY